MQSLTAEGTQLVNEVAQRHKVSVDAVVVLLRALERGGGVQAQFSHPDLGGMGQWSRGGMVMIGDMFNHRLKFQVDALCSELSDLRRAHTFFPPEERSASSDAGLWWPADCGTPRSSGGQNDLRYAYFPDTRRLAIQRGGEVEVYDTGDHRIGGISQQQSGGQDLTFTSQHGAIRLHELTRLGGGARTYDAAEGATPTAVSVEPAAPDDLIAMIERLHELQKKGVLSEAEFETKKKELLARL